MGRGKECGPKEVTFINRNGPNVDIRAPKSSSWKVEELRKVVPGRGNGSVS